MNKEEILNKIYKEYGTDSGILFGITEKPIVEAIINFTLNESQSDSDEYWQKRCEAAEDLVSVMDAPKNYPFQENTQFKLFGSRNDIWQKTK